MKKRTQKRKSKHIFFRLVLLAFSVYTIYAMIAWQSQLMANKKILNEKEKQVSAKKISNQELEELLKSGSEKDLIERAARDKLDYVFANEQVFEDISGK